MWHCKVFLNEDDQSAKAPETLNIFVHSEALKNDFFCMMIFYKKQRYYF